MTRPSSQVINRSQIRIGAITVPSDPDNIADFEFAIDSCTWGSPRILQSSDTESPRKNDVLLIAAGYSRPDTSTKSGTNSSPRVEESTYLKGNFQRVILVEVTGDPFESHSPHWQGEDGEYGIRYPFRFPISVIGELTDLSLSSIPTALARNFHRSINAGSRPLVATLSAQEATEIAIDSGADNWDDLIANRQRPDFDLVDSEGISAAIPRKNRSSSGQGRPQNPERIKATELFAEEVAIAHYERLGWTVVKKGKPFDLDCTRGKEKLRVEVKGSTGAAGDVDLTIKEVRSARTYISELFVVYNIDLVSDGEKTIYDSSGGSIQRTTYSGVEGSGTAVVFQDWEPSDGDLAPRAFRYRVPWEAGVKPETIAH